MIFEQSAQLSIYLVRLQTNVVNFDEIWYCGSTLKCVKQVGFYWVLVIYSRAVHEAEM